MGETQEPSGCVCQLSSREERRLAGFRLDVEVTLRSNQNFTLRACRAHNGSPFPKQVYRDVRGQCWHTLLHSPWLRFSSTHSERQPGLQRAQLPFAAPVCISDHLSRLDQESKCFIGPTFSGHLSLSLAADSVTAVYRVSVLS